MAQERTAVSEAYAGDIIGVFDPGNFRIGDTIYSGNKPIKFQAIPSFPPEHFARIAPKDSLKRKQFLKGMEQLAQEGAVQIYRQPAIGTETFIVGVVGMLQFDILEHRLKNEYKVDIRRETLNYRLARWAVPKTGHTLPPLDTWNITSTSMIVLDYLEQPVILFESPWAIDWALQRNEALALEEINDRN